MALITASFRTQQSKKAVATQVLGERGEGVVLRRREGPRRDVLPLHRFVHLLEIDPDLVVQRDAVESEPSRVGDIESHSPAVRVPLASVSPSTLTSSGTSVGCDPRIQAEKLAKTSAPHDEIVTVLTHQEAVCPLPFPGREQMFEPGRF